MEEKSKLELLLEKVDSILDHFCVRYKIPMQESDDLRQEGVLCLIDILNEHPDKHIDTLKAFVGTRLKWKYCHMLRHYRAKCREESLNVSWESAVSNSFDLEDDCGVGYKEVDVDSGYKQATPEQLLIEQEFLSRFKERLNQDELALYNAIVSPRSGVWDVMHELNEANDVKKKSRKVSVLAYQKYLGWTAHKMRVTRKGLKKKTVSFYREQKVLECVPARYR